MIDLRFSLLMFLYSLVIFEISSFFIFDFCVQHCKSEKIKAENNRKKIFFLQFLDTPLELKGKCMSLQFNSQTKIKPSQQGNSLLCLLQDEILAPSCHRGTVLNTFTRIQISLQIFKVVLIFSRSVCHFYSVLFYLHALL